jgi:hypothetical protein
MRLTEIIPVGCAIPMVHVEFWFSHDAFLSYHFGTARPAIGNLAACTVVWMFIDVESVGRDCRA